MRYFRTPTRRFTPSRLVFAFIILCALAPSTDVAAQGTGAGSAPDISYTVSMTQPHTHLLEVEMRVRTPSAQPQVELVMPVWTPGSYLVREFARHVQDFAAHDGGGRALLWRKTNKNTWRVETAGARDVRVNYSVYANELTVRTNELNDRHAFWNNAALLMHVNNQLNAPATLRIVPFRDDWKIATGLPAVGGRRDTFRAENFDILYDSPVLVSNHIVIPFEVRGIPHRFVIDGTGNYDTERIRRDVPKIVEAAAAMMGELPYRDYTFLLMTHPTSGGGGLEHSNSTALMWRRYEFRTDAQFTDFLTLVAHEYFHLWNVKRIRPDALGPFNYSAENYTRLLWVAEGLTSYYENLLVRRAGLMTDRDYLTRLATAIRSLQNTPGRLEQSVEEASFDAWIKYYRQDENTVNSAVSYYDKGSILGALLDLEIRRRSNGAHSLDDVLRALYNDFYKRNRNYTPEDFQRLSEQMAGGSLDPFFARYVRGREELDYETAFASAGLRLDTVGGDSQTSRPPAERPYLGATLGRTGERAVVATVIAGTPAYNQGLSTGDEIVAIDGVRVTRENFDARLAEKRPGDTVRLTIFRLEDLRTLDLKLAGRIDAPYRLLPISNPTSAQTKTYQDWLNTPFPKTQ